MNYVIQDLPSSFFISVDPTPTIPFLLRESVEHATKFDERSKAIVAMEAATVALRGKYRDLELAVKPATSSSKSRRQTSSVYNSRITRHGDPADRYNEQVAHARKYDRDMS